MDEKSNQNNKAMNVCCHVTQQQYESSSPAWLTAIAINTHNTNSTRISDELLWV